MAVNNLDRQIRIMAVNEAHPVQSFDRQIETATAQAEAAAAYLQIVNELLDRHSRSAGSQDIIEEIHLERPAVIRIAAEAIFESTLLHIQRVGRILRMGRDLQHIAGQLACLAEEDDLIDPKRMGEDKATRLGDQDYRFVDLKSLQLLQSGVTKEREYVDKLNSRLWKIRICTSIFQKSIQFRLSQQTFHNCYLKISSSFLPSAAPRSPRATT